MKRVFLCICLSVCCSLSCFETRLLLIRHGETDWNAEGRLQGRTNIPLNQRGIAQAQEMAQMISLFHPDIGAIYSSNLSRAYQTACIVAEVFQLTVHQCGLLAEYDVGEARGKTEAEIVELYGSEEVLIKRYPDHRERWNHSLIPGQELINDRIRRVRAALIEIAKEHPHEKVAVFTHRGCLRAFIADVGDISEVDSIHIPNCAAIEVIYHSESQNKPFEILCKN